MFQDGLLRGRRILVTGGGTGLGKGMAEKFSALGADIFICGRRKAVCEATATELSGKYGGKVKSYGVDIRDAAAVDAPLL
jgi:NAD(P)-dependent dehydrogenase (short-subunit alcohol dehydrogenase family)